METEIAELPPAVAEKAKRELFEDPETRPQKINELRTELQKEPGLNARLDDAFLLRFLRARKFDIERAKHLLLDYYRIKAEEQELMATCLPSLMERPMKEAVTCMLPDRDANGCRIYYLRAGRWDPDEMDMSEMFAYTVMLFEHFIRDPETQVHGFVVIKDLHGIGMKHVTHLSPSYMRRMNALLQDTFPARFKAVHIINEPTIMDILWNLTSPFLKKKMKKRITFHGHDLKSLQEYFDPDILPIELGGNKPLDTAWSDDQIKASEAYFEAQKSYSLFGASALTTDHGEDPGPGLQGAFHKLNVD